MDDRFPSPGHIQAAGRIAMAMGGSLLFVRTLGTANRSSGPADPVEWDMFRRRALDDLHAFIEGSEDLRSSLVCKLAEGNQRSQLLACISPERHDILAAIRSDAVTPQQNPLSSILVSGYDHTTLILPEKLDRSPPAGELRLLVPLDGSSKAECALTTAVRLCRQGPAELVLLHSIELPTAAKAFKLSEDLKQKQSQMVRGQRSAAIQYLSRLQDRLHGCGLKVKVKISETNDERRDLVAKIGDLDAGLVVLSPKGCGDHDDVVLGDIARFIVEKSPVPVLLSRNLSSQGAYAKQERNPISAVRKPLGHLQ